MKVVFVPVISVIVPLVDLENNVSIEHKQGVISTKQTCQHDSIQDSFPQGNSNHFHHHFKHFQNSSYPDKVLVVWSR